MSHDPSVDSSFLCRFTDAIEPIAISHIMARKLNKENRLVCCLEGASGLQHGCVLKTVVGQQQPIWCLVLYSILGLASPKEIGGFPRQLAFITGTPLHTLVS
jgi:hypothetical protein